MINLEKSGFWVWTWECFNTMIKQTTCSGLIRLILKVAFNKQTLQLLSQIDQVVSISHKKVSIATRKYRIFAICLDFLQCISGIRFSRVMSRKMTLIIVTRIFNATLLKSRVSNLTFIEDITPKSNPWLHNIVNNFACPFE